MKATISRCCWFVLAIALVAGTSPAYCWEVRRLHPFVEATADQLLKHLGPVASQLTLSGLQNDWIHKGLAIVASGQKPETVTISLAGSRRFREHVRLRVVGFIDQKDLGYVLDPIFANPGALEVSKYGQYMRNFARIYSFPTVTATARDPVVLWVTADTRDMAAGKYNGSLVVNDVDGECRTLPVRLLVKPYRLPEENPLVTFAWEWIPQAPTKEAGARLLLEYGINACHVRDDMKAAWRAGFKFFIFVFSPSWHGSVADADEAAVDREIAKIKKTIARLKLRPDQWAIYTIDEPHDTIVPGQVAWCRYIRQKWPQARFLYNPGWGGDPYDPTATVEGTIKPLMGCADVWLPYSWWVTTSVRKGGLELMKSTGKPVWFYEIMSYKYSRQPDVGRSMLRTLPWTAWKYRLQGACWYALNATDWPWSRDPQKTGHGCIYGTIPGRGLEAFREGVQEYKRLYELRKMGVDEAILDGFVQRALHATRVTEIDRVRHQMDDLLLQRVMRK